MNIETISLKDLGELAKSHFATIAHEQVSTLLRIPIEGEQIVLMLHLAPMGQYQMFWPEFPRNLIWDDLVPWQGKFIGKQKAKALRADLTKCGISTKASPFFSSAQEMGDLPSYTEAAIGGYPELHGCRELIVPEDSRVVDAVCAYFADWEKTFPSLVFRELPIDEWGRQPSFVSARSPDDAKNLFSALLENSSPATGASYPAMLSNIEQDLTRILHLWSTQDLEDSCYFEFGPNLIPSKMLGVSVGGEEAIRLDRIEELRVEVIEKFLSPLFYDSLVGYLQNLDRHRAKPFSELSLEDVKNDAWINPKLVERLYVSAKKIEQLYPLLKTRPLRELL